MGHLKINLLGVCNVSWQDKTLAIPRRQTRALLYHLAARLEPIPRGKILFLLWADIPENRARRNLTRLLSSLRAALPVPDMLVVDDASAGLNPDLVWSDAEQLIRAGISEVPESLAAAADLYRGAFMSGFELPGAPEFEAWQTETGRFVESRFLMILERLVAFHSNAAGHNRAIDYANRYLAIDNLAEAMHRSLIALHVAAGNRTAAMRQYEHCTLVLEQELGVSPLPETRAALEAAPVRPVIAGNPVQPPLQAPLCGREAVLRRLHERCGLPGGTFILLSGEPGVGKTRLMGEFAGQQRSLPLVLAGGSYPVSQSLPYNPILQALRSTFDRPELWRSMPRTWLSELLLLMPDLLTLVPDLPVPIQAAPGQSQARIMVALSQLLLALASENPLLLCLDDLHWADESTLAWLEFHAGTWGSAPMFIIATCHNQSAPPLAQLRQQLHRSRRLVEIELDGLSTSAVHDLLLGLVPPNGVPPALAERLQLHSGGNPFFIEEIVRDLQESGRIEDPPSELPLPATVREAILSRLARLSPVARQLVEAAAVLDPLLELDVLQHTSARSESEIADGLDELLVHRLMTAADTGSGHDGLAFPHGLIRLAVYRTLTPWRRRLLHRRAGESLSRHRPQKEAVLARHFQDAGDWELALAHYQLAADQAAGISAYETALELIDQAMEILPHIDGPAAARLALLRRRLALQQVLVRLDGWEADIAEVHRLAVLSRDTAGRLDALEARISLLVLQSDFSGMEDTADQALALAQEIGDRVAEARILHKLGWHLADVLGRLREGLEHLQKACRLAESAGAVELLYRIRCNLAFAQRADGQCEAARVTSMQALELTSYEANAAPRPDFADALRELGEANAYLGHWETARALLLPLLGLYRTLNDPWNQGAVLHNFGLYSSSIGQHAEAIAAMRELVELSVGVGLPADSDYGIWHRSGLARVLLAAGKLEDAAAVLADIQHGGLKPGRPYLAWVRAAGEHLLAAGEPAQAAAILRPAVDWWRGSTSLHDTDVLLLLAEAELALGERETAKAAVEEAAAHLEPTDMARYRLRLHWMRYEVGGGEPALAAARAELARQAARFEDAGLKTAFLENVTLHRRIAVH